jgi:hypothetical protein
LRQWFAIRIQRRIQMQYTLLEQASFAGAENIHSSDDRSGAD